MIRWTTFATTCERRKMRAILDTHAFLWFITDDARLSTAAGNVIEGEADDLLLSVASIWEIAIKVGLGRLPLPAPIHTFLPRQIAANDLRLLPIAMRHALSVATLPLHHRDPFDRMLVAQALTEDVPILSADAELDRYGVQRLW
ncbi:type II toxin-antitoxin system VapC family toxin [Longimicrobium sp.]|uniref:type II toxin-antitoxin system VapC family toxin n=1 Tax=Longimicrobium sp. TaxID=2029185 RepID=UPI002E339C2F|nr:type II toxin-antitoxin system VapC family toxin [Longimicrobium sp.]HEX6038519.1 type II toxin-antitoxin system VapC family toxin [Longimicrobium sp.]